MLEKSKKIQKKFIAQSTNDILMARCVNPILASIQRVSDKKSRMYAFYIGTKRRGTYYVNTNQPETLNQHELMISHYTITIPGSFTANDITIALKSYLSTFNE